MNYVLPPVTGDLDASHKRTCKSYNDDLKNGNQLTQWNSVALLKLTMLVSQQISKNFATKYSDIFLDTILPMI